MSESPERSESEEPKETPPRRGPKGWSEEPEGNDNDW